MNKPARRRGPGLFLCLAPFALSAVLLGAARRVPAWAEWYALHIYPLFPHTVGRLAGLIPLSLFELLLLALGAGALLLTAWVLLALAAPAARRGGGFFRPLCAGFGLLCLLFTLTAGINYNREPFADRYGLPVRAPAAGELRALYGELVAEAAAAAALGGAEAAEPNRSAANEWRKEARRAMSRLSRRYALISSYPPPKPVFFSPTMSRLGISGIFSPFTLEANYNSDMPAFQIPSALCHELAHLAGYMREEEANFIAYLACRESFSPAFRYSGALFALGYVLDALRAVSSAQEYAALLAELPPAAAEDFRLAGEYWRQYAGRAAELQTELNDAYLRANAQSAGVESYGLVVDLLLAYRRGDFSEQWKVESGKWLVESVSFYNGMDFRRGGWQFGLGGIGDSIRPRRMVSRTCAGT
ncbi:MAG: DUF3810 domain-containing protein [Gracilibacteraceae bacterium]|nr:DUF3810 domain-containing protein [Gracilibacteraceae bacterium]